MDQRDRRIALALFVTALVPYAWFFGGGGWNQNAHFDLTRALVERRTLSIDFYRDNTGDVSFHEGHTYVNKAPGVSLLAAIPYAFLYAIESASDVDIHESLTQTLNLWLCTVAVCGISGALIPAAIYVYARRRTGSSRGWAVAVALAIAFATPLFVYSTALFVHVPSALFLFLCFARVSASPDERPWLTGLYGGLAGLCNYLCIPVVVSLGLTLLWPRRGGLRRFGMFVAGGIPAAILLLSYQAVAFGSPLRTPLETMHQAFVTPGAWLGAFGSPRLAALWGITFSPYRGLFFLSPLLIFSVVGWFRMKRALPAEGWMIAAIAAYFVFANASFNGWHGGWAIGPRYLIPLVPLLAIAMLFITPSMRLVWTPLTIVSFASNFIVAAVDPLPPESILNPLIDYEYSLFLTGRTTIPQSGRPALTVPLGHVSANMHAVDEYLPIAKHQPGSRESEWASFNLGEAFAPGSPWSVIPALLWIAGAGVLLWRMCRE